MFKFSPTVLVKSGIENELKEKKYQMFIRKVAPEFPDEILENYIYDAEFNNQEFIKKRIKSYLDLFIFWGFILTVFFVAILILVK